MAQQMHVAIAQEGAYQVVSAEEPQSRSSDGNLREQILCLRDEMEKFRWVPTVSGFTQNLISVSMSFFSGETFRNNDVTFVAVSGHDHALLQSLSSKVDGSALPVRQLGQWNDVSAGVKWLRLLPRAHV
jgi:hypothetical protein